MMTKWYEVGLATGLVGILEHKFVSGQWFSLGQKYCHGKLALILLMTWYLMFLQNKKY